MVACLQHPIYITRLVAIVVRGRADLYSNSPWNSLGHIVKNVTLTLSYQNLGLLFEETISLVMLGVSRELASTQLFKNTHRWACEIIGERLQCGKGPFKTGKGYFPPAPLFRRFYRAIGKCASTFLALHLV